MMQLQLQTVTNVLIIASLNMWADRFVASKGLNVSSQLQGLLELNFKVAKTCFSEYFLKRRLLRGSLQCGVIVGWFNLKLHSRKFKPNSTAQVCQAAIKLVSACLSLCEISHSIEASCQTRCLKQCDLMASAKINKDYSERRQTCRVMLGNWLSALLGLMPTPLLQDKSPFTSCLDCDADLILFQIGLVDYFGILACLLFFVSSFSFSSFSWVLISV